MPKITAVNFNLASQPDPTQHFSVAVQTSPGAQALYFNTLNQLVVTLTNNTNAAITLKGGAPVCEKELPPTGPTAFYLMFGGRLTSDQMSKIQMKQQGWNPGKFYDGDFPAVALIPSQDVPIPAMGSLQLTVTNIVVSGTGASAELTVDYRNVPGVSTGSPQWSLPAQNPPSGGNDLVLTPTLLSDAGLTPDITLISSDPLHPQANRLKLRLKNDTPSPVPIADTIAINVWFLYAEAPGYVALTTPTLAKQINLVATRVGQTLDAWTSQINDDHSGRTWTLLPKDLKMPGSQLLDAHGGALELAFDSITTLLAPGGTAVYVQWVGIPKYNDGYYAIDFDKRPAAKIKAFTVAPSHFDPFGHPVTATFTWDVANAVSVQIVGVRDVTGLTTLQVDGVTGRDFVMQVKNADGSIQRPDGHATIVSYDEFLCRSTFVLRDHAHTSEGDKDGRWTYDAGLVETLKCAPDGTGHYWYAVDGGSGNRQYYTPIHDHWDAPITWTRSGAQISVTTPNGPIVLQASGDTLTWSQSINISFNRRNKTFAPA